MTQDEIDDFMDKITPLSHEEKVEAMLEYFCLILDRMNTEQLAALHAHCVSRQDGSEDEAVMLEVVDAHRAFRELRNWGYSSNNRRSVYIYASYGTSSFVSS